MTFFESISTCFKKYADFTGCASRSEYWWWILFSVLLSIVFALIGAVPRAIVAVVTLLPTLAVASRRLHDTDRSGWLQLIGLIPVIGTILVIVWYCQDSRRPTRFASEAPLSLEKV